jgi:hypothetical protein
MMFKRCLHHINIYKVHVFLDANIQKKQRTVNQ